MLSTIKAFATPSVSLDKRDVEKVHRASEIIRVWSRENATRFVQQRTHEPLGVQYGSDLTPLTTRELYKAAIAGVSVTRSGKASHEFLIQRLFLHDLDGCTATVFEEPLTLDKSRDSATSLHCASYSVLRVSSDTKASSSFSTSLIAIKSCMERLQRKWYVAKYDADREQLGNGKAHRQWIRNWYECEGCSCHDFHGGLKWSMLVLVDDKEVFRSSFLMMESCVNGYNLLQQCLGEWLLEVMEFTDEAFPDAAEVYTLFGCSDEVLADMIDLEMRFLNGRLLIAARHRGKPGLLNLLVVVFMKAWTFRRWTKTRWLQFGKGGRVMTRACFCGLLDLVKFICNAGKSTYFIGGVLRNVCPHSYEGCCDFWHRFKSE